MDNVRIVIIILIYHRHKPVDLIQRNTLDIEAGIVECRNQMRIPRALVSWTCTEATQNLWRKIVTEISARTVASRVLMRECNWA
jgi:hypothetical protein